MIKRINHIKNFGVFQNYRRTGDIQDFTNLNIIYGWNYSGKTTISRIFQHFELTEKNPDYSSAEFELEDYNGTKFTHQINEIPNRTLRVFNSDFIQNNLKWDGSSFDAIQVLLLGEDAIKAEKEIEQKKGKQIKIKSIQRKLNEEIARIDNVILTGLTNKASEIKQTLRLVSAYTRTHLKPLFDSLKYDYTKYLLSKKEVEKLLPIATSSDSDKLPILSEFNPSLKLDDEIEKTKELLKKIPELSQTIQYFKDNPEVANWVEKGLPIHENKTKCEFCGNDLEQSRLDSLMAHFSEDLKNHKIDLLNQIQSLETSNIVLPTYQKRDFYKDLWDKYELANNDLKNSVKLFNKQVDLLIEKLKTKYDKPFEEITNFKDIIDNTSELLKTIEEYNAVIKSNNTQTNQFDKAKSDAIDLLKKHYTAEFIEKIKLDKLESKSVLYKSRIDKFNTLFSNYTTEIQELEAEISQAQKGREQINEYIEKFLGRNEIQVEVIKEGDKERFTLKRENSKAKNLSEGEKTAIAFSFFLTKLGEIKDLDKTIVYIDDPISSLDSNHIFQVNAILKDFFFHKKDEKWELKCKQLFISTHNFDFFNLLTELPKSKELQKFFYQVRRINKNESVLEKLPKSLQNYSSEYHYLFEELYNFNKSENKNDYPTLMGIPNAVRRFVELYTYSRLPSNKGTSVDQRADTLWGVEKSKRILKVLNYFSHSNSIDRMMRNSDLICDIENAVSDLMKELEKDEKHFDELKKSIKK